MEDFGDDTLSPELGAQLQQIAFNRIEAQGLRQQLYIELQRPGDSGCSLSISSSAA